MKFHLFLVIWQHYSLYHSSVVLPKLAHWRIGKGDTGESIFPHGQNLISWTFGKECVKQLKVDGLDGYIFFLMYFTSSFCVLIKAYVEDVLNVLCFGGAAKSVWVLLYVMSTKRTKHGLQFLDSSEKVIIQGTLSQ